MRARGVAGTISRIGRVNTANYAIAMALIRRTRGALLRLVRRRGLAMLVGAALAGPAAWVEFSGGHFEWWMQGLALIGGGVGIALLWTGIVGVPPDWIDDA
jgi:hypothetical protein